jgi:hypothetical protein
VDGALGLVPQALDFGRNPERRVGSPKIGSGVGFGCGQGAQGGQVFERKDRLIEDQAELAGGFVRDGFERGQVRRLGKLLLEAGDGAVGNAAGVDEVEVPQIGSDVEGEAVRGNAAGHMDADGADLSAPGAGLADRFTALVQSAAARRAQSAPDAGEFADAAGGQAEFAAEADEGFFHEPDEVDRPEAAADGRVAQAAEIEDRVADQLAGAVVGHVAAAVDLVEGDAAAFEQLVRCQNVGTVGVTAQGEHGRVLQQQEHVADAILLAEIDELGLETQGLGVVDAAEIEGVDHDSLRYPPGGLP